MADPCATLAARAIELGAQDVRIIDVGQLVFDERSYLKCRFGCDRWGRYWTCPPHLVLTPEQFMAALRKYANGIVIKTADPQTGQDVTLAIEKEAMLVCGRMFAFGMVLCVKCEACAWPEPCRYPHLARPAMDAYGIDIGKTVEPLGFTIEFDREGKLLPAWYSMVLV